MACTRQECVASVLFHPGPGLKWFAEMVVKPTAQIFGGAWRIAARGGRSAGGKEARLQPAAL